MSARREIRNCYFKDQDPRRPLMSGLPLPKGEDGVVRNCVFIRCTFHPNCSDVIFEDCELIDCDGDEYIGLGEVGR